MAKIYASQPRLRPNWLTCRHVSALVMEYLNDDLDPDMRTAFDSHLDGCQDCRAFLATYKQTLDATHVLQYDEMPADLRARTRATIREKVEKTAAPAVGDAPARCLHSLPAESFPLPPASNFIEIHVTDIGDPVNEACNTLAH